MLPKGGIIKLCTNISIVPNELPIVNISAKLSPYKYTIYGGSIDSHVSDMRIMTTENIDFYV